MYEKNISQALIMLQDSLENRHSSSAIIQLISAFFVIQASIQESAKHLKNLLPEDNNATIALNNLDANLLSNAISIENMSLINDDSDVIEFYRLRWQRSDLSPESILNILVDSVRGITASLQARLVLLQNSITQDTVYWYDLLKENANHLEKVSQMITEYLHGQS